MGSTGNSTGTHVHFQVYYNKSSASTVEELQGLVIDGVKVEDYKVGTQDPWNPKYYSSTNNNVNIQITITTTPVGLQINVDDVTYNSPKTFSWNPGSQHKISTPTPQPSQDQKIRYNYSSWSDGWGQTHSITVPSSDTTYTASFTTQYLLDTSVNSSGSGSIELNPSGPWYNAGVSVQLTARPKDNYTFKNWSGDLSGSNNPTTLNMNGPKSVTANFGGGSVQITVTTNPIVQYITVDGTSYAPPHTFSWTPGSQHTIGTPTPQPSQDQKTRYNYSSWSDGGEQTHQITVPSSDTTYTASFTPQYLLDTSVNPSGSGTIELNPLGPWYNAGAQVQLTAAPKDNYTFKNWSGDLSGSNNPATLSMDRPKSITANFDDEEIPNGSTSINEGAEYTNTRDVTLNVSATDNVGVVGYYHSEDFTIPPNPDWVVVPSDTNFVKDISYELSSGDGEKTVYIWFKDAVGNISNTISDSIILDTTSPTLDAEEVNYTHVDVTYSEAINSGEILSNYTANNGLVISGVTNIGGNTYRLTTTQHAVNVTYTITVSGVTDLAGNTIDSGANSASFTRATNTAPTVPTGKEPLNGSEVVVLKPTLEINASTDAEGDEVTYRIEVSNTSNFGSMTAWVEGLEGNETSASWDVPVDLTDNTVYYWKALANDGNLNSLYMDTMSFFVNTSNDNPGVPGISEPADGMQVSSQTPVLSVTNTTDVDNDALTYEFDGATDNLFANIVAGITGVAQDAGTTSWTVDVTLDDNRTYYWRAKARDEHGAAGGWVNGSFMVNMANDVPTTPVLASPANGSEVATLMPALVVNNATDLDGDSLSYIFEADKVNTFDNADKQTSGQVSEGAGTTSWTVASNLQDNTTYFWRVKASDNVAEGSWMATGTFFVNTVNDPPGVPTLNNPANNSEVTSLTPSLQVNAATDIDNDILTYDYEVYSDSNLDPGSLVKEATGQGTSWTVSEGLVDNTRYYWRARVQDEHGVYGDWMTANSFFVNNNGVNDPPSIYITKPGASDPATRLTVFTLEWTDGDPDSNATISLYYDTDNTGNDGTLITTGIHEDDTVDSYNWNTESLADGPYYVYGKIEDGTTIIYGYSSGPVTMDRTAPETTATPVGGLYNGTQDVTLTSNEPTTIYYTVDGTEPTVSSPVFTTPINIASTTTLKFFGVDEAGNTETVKTVMYTIDSELPSGSIVINNEAEYTNSTTVSLSLSVSDAESVVGMQFSNDGTTWTAEDTYTTTKDSWELAAGDGTKTVSVRYKDSAGNWSGAFSDTIILDTTVPAITGTSPSNNATNIGINSVITATFNEAMDDSTIHISTFTVNGVAGEVDYDSANKIARLVPSASLNYSTTYTAEITTEVKDLADNAMASKYLWSFTTEPSPDITAPVVTITSPTSVDTYTTNNAMIDLGGAASDDISGISNIVWSNSNGNSGTASGTTSWAISDITLSKGDNKITVKATDGAGNTGTDIISITYNEGKAPTVVTGLPSNVTSNIATLHGTVNANWLETTAWFEYGTVSALYGSTSATQIVDGSGDTPVSIGVNGLTDETTYYYRIVAQNSAGITHGEEDKFTTVSNWKTIAVEAPKWFSYFSSRAIALDADNHPHIAYGGDRLYYVHYNGTSWHYETVDISPGVGYYASLAIDASGKMHISYRDRINHTIKYATNASGSWKIATVDNSGDVGLYTSIAIDTFGNAHVSYYDLDNSDLKYATNASGSWITYPIDGTGDVGQYTSLAVDTFNKVHISYYDDTNGDLKYATNASGSWMIENVDNSGDVGQYTSIAVGISGEVHMSYYDVTYGNLKYVTNTSGSWEKTDVDSSGQNTGLYTSIGIDALGKIYISYYDKDNGDLKYATNASGLWTKKNISDFLVKEIDREGDVGLYTSLAVEPSGKIHISYYDTTNDDLKYATDASHSFIGLEADKGKYVAEKVDNGRYVGMYSSIAVDMSGKMHISYYDGTNGNLMYATNASGLWVRKTVDHKGDVGWYTSIAVDKQGKVHISYYNWTHKILKYATNASGFWITKNVDEGEDTGLYTSLAVDTSDKVHISYYDRTNKDLKYATNVSGLWVTTTVDSNGVVGMDTSIAIDISNKVHISYYDVTNHDLKYATNASGLWKKNTVGTYGDLGKYNSIAVDTPGKVYISYYNRDDGDLVYATNVSGKWLKKRVDFNGNVGIDTSIAVDTSKNAHICYYDVDNSDLKYATNVSGSWVITTIDSSGNAGRYTSIALNPSNGVYISYYDITNGNLKCAWKASLASSIKSNENDVGIISEYDASVTQDVSVQAPDSHGDTNGIKHSGHAGYPPLHIHGHVFSESGDAIEGVKLSLKGEGYAEIVESDANGCFTFEYVDADTYRIIAEKDGYRKSIREVKIPLEKNKEEGITIQLLKSN
ncbi:MAG: Ig-like domain-containing protein [Candidatus Jettenia sp.]|nr:MAG: Ig-like domain-containing protein [Candidatus Jettenia sp.]